MADEDPGAGDKRELEGDRPVVPDYFVPAVTETRLVTLQTMTPMEAELAQAKLESEGILCFAANGEMARVNPLWNIPVRLQVRQDDVERAKEILARAPQNVAEGEYVEEEWRCPQCRKKAFDLLPLTPVRRWLRDLWFVLLVLPFVWWLVPVEEVLSIPSAVKSWGGGLWFVAVAVIGAVVVAGKRGKRCRECGWTRAA